ncbi:hypothetical protein N658DRAFT_523542 [Parathielavia hyrcaniae]|uniref:Uncharacterized protein n=1 Tax=Parathielavia hyrcaniae TaxID=113614 RepID=A0AAN6Q6G0_9PEZI|nr:hypothetical protein N658DRAFT_523542 [Parathielavia hyrcaniae]
MAPTRMTFGSPASSDDDSDSSPGGGAPLYSLSPEQRFSDDGKDSAARHQNVSSFANARLGDSIDKRLQVRLGSAAERARTPSDQGIQTPEPPKPQRSFSKSTLLAAAQAYLNTTTTSAGAAVPPALNLASYPGPGTAGPSRQASLSDPAAAAPSVPGANSVSIARPASQAQDRSSIPGSTTHSFIAAMQAMTLTAAEENLHPAQKAHRDETCKLQARVWGLRQGMYRQNAIPKEFLMSFDYDVEELMKNTVTMNKSLDSLADELKKKKARPDGEQECARGLEARIRDLEGDLEDSRKREENSQRALANIAARADEDLRAIQFLQEKLRQNEMTRMILQEQVNGKRNLWLNIHNDPQERAAVLGTLARSSTPLSGQTVALPVEQNYSQSARAPGSVRSATSHTVSSVQSGSDRSGLYGGAVPFPTGPFAGGGYSPFQPIPHSHSVPAVYSGQPPHQRRLSSATATSSQSSAGRPPAVARRTPRVSTIAETGSPTERKAKTPHASSIVATRASSLDDAECLKWADEFQSLFALVYGFCTSYFHEAPALDESWRKSIRAEANGDLWEYICKICRTPLEQEPGENAMRLLSDGGARPYLMQRLILQHILVFVCTSEGWKDYSEDVDDEMEKLEARLKTIDSSKTYERQVIIDRRASLVTEMSEGANAKAFKNFKQTQHHQFLKTMIAPFLSKRSSHNHNHTNTGHHNHNHNRHHNNNHTSSNKPSSTLTLSTKNNATLINEAFYDLYTIATSAWDLSARLLTSRLSFQFVWTDVGARFSAAAHEPLDFVGGDRDRLALQQAEHGRIALCATPAVTVRNDRGLSVDVRRLVRAGVLVGRY